MNQEHNYLRDGRELETFINSTLDDLIRNPEVREQTSSIDIPEKLCLFKSSVKLVLRNVIKKLITHEKGSPDSVKECIFCLSDKANVINVCKCGLESVCYQCFIKRNSAEILQHATPAIINKVSNRISEIKLLELVKVINCQVCGDISPLNYSIDRYILDYDVEVIESNDILHDINYYSLQNKHLFEHITSFDTVCRGPGDSLSSVDGIKPDIELTEFGYALEIIPEPESMLIIKLNTATQEYILKNVTHKGNINLSNCEIKIQIQKMQYFVLDAIYYKCVSFGLKYLEKLRPAKGLGLYNNGNCSIFLVKWNRLCCSINYIINVYMSGDCSRSYASCMVFLDILKSIEI